MSTDRIASSPLLSGLVLMIAIFTAIPGTHAKPPFVERGEDPATGLKYWLWDNDGFYLLLTQRLPDQTRGYFESRGFDRESTEIAGTSCVFQTMIKNSGTEPSASLSADLNEWLVVSGDIKQPMLLREYWQKLWLDRKQSESARIAFEWSLLPTKVHYDINDYNWGMSSYGLPPGSHFDLLFNWYRNGKKYTGRLNDVACADDIHPAPPSQ
jgi:hypothetical protein